MEKQSVVLRFPRTLLDRVDTYKEEKGFGTRTQTIFHLLQIALEQSDNRDGK
jgi:metal-responsive CopG/Arc/MetJ family transcriptional regulator